MADHFVLDGFQGYQPTARHFWTRFRAW